MAGLGGAGLGVSPKPLHARGAARPASHAGIPASPPTPRGRAPGPWPGLRLAAGNCSWRQPTPPARATDTDAPGSSVGTGALPMSVAAAVAGTAPATACALRTARKASALAAAAASSFAFTSAREPVRPRPRPSWMNAGLVGQNTVLPPRGLRRRVGWGEGVRGGPAAQRTPPARRRGVREGAGEVRAARGGRTRRGQARSRRRRRWRGPPDRPWPTQRLRGEGGGGGGRGGGGGGGGAGGREGQAPRAPWATRGGGAAARCAARAAGRSAGRDRLSGSPASARSARRIAGARMVAAGASELQGRIYGGALYGGKRVSANGMNASRSLH
jgi:hypothetical protein